MPEEKLAKVAEGRQRVVRERGGVVAFLSIDANTDMSRLNHVNIVCSIADCQSCQLGHVTFAKVLANVLDSLSFLSG